MSLSIPKTLKDNHLKDTIISLIFRTNYNREYIHNRIMELLTVKGCVIEPSADALSKQEALIYGLNNFRIRLDRTQIQFNCITNYPGWEQYGALVKRILKSLEEIMEFQNAQIRYISVYDGIRIFQHINGTIHINSFPPIMGEEYAFHVKVVDHQNPDLNAIATVRLINEKGIAPRQTASFVDIALESIANNNTYQTVLDFIHLQEKLLFFSIITDEFKNSLGPLY